MRTSFGAVLAGDGKGVFTAIPATRSGFVVPGQARDIQRVRTARGDLYLVARNDDRPLAFRSTKANAATGMVAADAHKPGSKRASAARRIKASASSF